MPATEKMNLPLLESTDTSAQIITKINEALSLISLHDHTAGKGVKVPFSALFAEEDLNFLSKKIVNPSEINFQILEGSEPSSNNTIFVKDNKIKFKDGNGAVANLGQASVPMGFGSDFPENPADEMFFAISKGETHDHGIYQYDFPRLAWNKISGLGGSLSKLIFVSALPSSGRDTTKLYVLEQESGGFLPGIYSWDQTTQKFNKLFGQQTDSEIKVDSSSFDKNLKPMDNTQQKVNERINNLNIGRRYSVVTATPTDPEVGQYILYSINQSALSDHINEQNVSVVTATAGTIFEYLANSKWKRIFVIPPQLAKATTPLAIAGENDTDYMTPLKTKEAIDESTNLGLTDTQSRQLDFSKLKRIEADNTEFQIGDPAFYYELDGTGEVTSRRIFCVCIKDHASTDATRPYGTGDASEYWLQINPDSVSSTALGPLLCTTPTLPTGANADLVEEFGALQLVGDWTLTPEGVALRGSRGATNAGTFFSLNSFTHPPANYFGVWAIAEVEGVERGRVLLTWAQNDTRDLQIAARDRVNNIPAKRVGVNFYVSGGDGDNYGFNLLKEDQTDRLPANTRVKFYAAITSASQVSVGGGGGSGGLSQQQVQNLIDMTVARDVTNVEEAAGVITVTKRDGTVTRINLPGGLTRQEIQTLIDTVADNDFDDFNIVGNQITFIRNDGTTKVLTIPPSHVTVTDGSITAAKLADGAVTTPKYADHSVTEAKLSQAVLDKFPTGNNQFNFVSALPSQRTPGRYYLLREGINERVDSSMQVNALTVPFGGPIQEYAGEGNYTFNHNRQRTGIQFQTPFEDIATERFIDANAGVTTSPLGGSVTAYPLKITHIWLGGVAYLAGPTQNRYVAGWTDSQQSIGLWKNERERLTSAELIAILTRVGVRNSIPVNFQRSSDNAFYFSNSRSAGIYKDTDTERGYLGDLNSLIVKPGPDGRLPEPTLEDYNLRKIGLENGGLRIVDRYLNSPATDAAVSFANFSDVNVRPGFTYRGVVSGVSLREIPNPQANQVIYYENTHNFLFYDATLLPAPVSQPVGWVPYNVPNYKGFASSLGEAIQKITGNDQIIFRSDLSLLEVSYNFRAAHPDLFNYIWTPTHDIRNILSRLDKTFGKFGILTAAERVVTSSYTFVGYASNVAATRPVGNFEGEKSEDIVGIYTATRQTGTAPPLSLIKEGSTYFAARANSDPALLGSTPLYVIINEKVYKVSDAINTAYFEVLGFAGFKAGVKYRVQVIFDTGRSWIVEGIKDGSITRDKLSAELQDALMSPHFYLGIIPASAPRAALVDNYTLLLHGLRDSAVASATKIRIVVNGQISHEEAWTVDTGKRVLPFAIDATEAANILRNLRGADYLQVQVIFFNAANQQIFGSELYTWPVT